MIGIAHTSATPSGPLPTRTGFGGQIVVEVAHTPATYIDQERHAGVRKAVAALSEQRTRSREARRNRALFLLAKTVERQNRIAGGGTVTLPICPGCGLSGRHVAGC